MKKPHWLVVDIATWMEAFTVFFSSLHCLSPLLERSSTVQAISLVEGFGLRVTKLSMNRLRRLGWPIGQS